MSWVQSLQNTRIEPRRDIIYGVTDRYQDTWWQRGIDFWADQKQISLKQKGLFFHSLQLLVSSGVPFTKALVMTGERQSNVRFKRILNTLTHDMEKQGLSFSAALLKHPKVFSISESRMVQAGELTGKVETALQAISHQLQKNIKLDLEIRKALTYPVTVMVGIIGAALIVMFYIIPQFTTLFVSVGSDLPVATQVLITLSGSVRSYWWLGGIGVVLIWQTFRQWQISETGQKIWDQWLLNAPVFGHLVRNIQTFRIASYLSVMLRSGVPLAKSLHIMAEIVTNKITQNALQQVEQAVRTGDSLSQSFLAEISLDPILGEVTSIGEKTGQIGEILEKLVEQYELEIDHQFKTLTSLLEPLVLLIVGLSVAFLAMAILLPVFELQNVFEAN